MQEIDPQIDDMPADLDAPVAQRFGRWRRPAQWVLLVVVVLTSLAIVVRPYAQSLQNPFAPAKTSAILLTSNVNWGKVTVDGIAVQPAAPPLVLHLAQRTRPYQITLVTPPFDVESCLLSIPVHAEDSCHPVISSSGGNGGTLASGGQNIAASIDFSLVPNDLPTADQSAILQVVDATLQAREAQTTVPVGGHYAVTTHGVPHIAAATTPLTAQLQTMRTGANALPNICESICAGLSFTNAAYPDRSHDVWNIRVAAHQRWQFIRDSDHAALGGIDESVSDDLLSLALSYAGTTWSLPINAAPIQTEATVNLCPHGQAAFETLTTTEPTLTLQEGAAFVDHHLEGCLISAQVQQESSTQIPTVTLLWRFGQLYVTDALSAMLLPDLPMASAADLSALQR